MWVEGRKEGLTNLYASLLFEVLGLLYSVSEIRKKGVTHLKRKTEFSPIAPKETCLTFSKRIYSVKSNTIILVNRVFMEFLLIFG